MTALRIAAAGVMIAALAGCQTVGDAYDRWFGSKPAQKPAELTTFTPSSTMRVLWQANVGNADKSFFYPAVSGNQVFVAGASGEVAGFQANTGQQVVRFNAGQRLASGVGTSGTLVLVGTPKGELLAFDRSGKSVWKAQLSGEILAPAAAEANVVAVRAGDGRVFGIDAATGKRLWVYQRTTPALSIRSATGLVIERGAVFAGFPGGRLVALAMNNGAVGWESVVALPRGTTELERVADVMGLPVVDTRQVCAVAYQGRAACFDPARGTTLWARDLSSYAGMSMDNRAVYVTDDKQAVISLDKNSGASLWKQDKLFGRGLTGPLAIGRFVAVGDFQGYVHLLSREDGSFAARIATDGSAIGAAPVALDLTSLLVQTRNGGVFAISVQ
jgi:outer membrane protein assembly factor BamB